MKYVYTDVKAFESYWPPVLPYFNNGWLLFVIYNLINSLCDCSELSFKCDAYHIKRNLKYSWLYKIVVSTLCLHIFQVSVNLSISVWLMLSVFRKTHEFQGKYNAISHLQCGSVIKLTIFSQIITNTSHSLPIRASCGMYFVSSNSDLYFASVTAMMFAIWCFIWSRYNGTRLYLE